MHEEFPGEQFLDVQRFGAIPFAIVLGENSKRRAREVDWIHRWRIWGGLSEESDGASLVGDIRWLQNQDEIIYWRPLQAFTSLMRNGEVCANSGSLDCVSFVAPYDGLSFTNLKARLY